MFGTKIMALADRLAQWSEVPDGLTCTYLSPAHRSVAADIRDLMRQAGLTAEHRCDRQCRRASCRRRSARAGADPGVALRHGPQRRQIRRPARRPGCTGRGRASAAARPQAAVSSRRDRILGRGGRALLRAFSAAARLPGRFDPEPARAARRRGRHLGGGDARGRARSAGIPALARGPAGAARLSRGAYRAGSGPAGGRACRSGS